MSLSQEPIPGTDSIPPDDVPLPFTTDEVPGERQRWIFWPIFTLAWAATGVAQGIAAFSIPKVVAGWDPDRATATLSFVVAMGGLATLVTTPIFGRMSDRSMSRLGVRRPWMLWGSLLALAGYLVFAVAGNVPLLVLGALATQIGWGMVAMAQHSLFADQIRRRIRALMSGVTGVAGTVGILVGTALSAQLANAGQVLLFLIPGGVAAFCSLLLFFALKDLRRTDPPAPMDWQGVLETFWVSPRRHPDFAWAWWCRFLMTSSILCVTTYLYLTISARFRLTDPVQIGGVQTQATAAYTLISLVTALVVGIVSDRLHRRKLPVFLGAALSAVGLVIAIAFGDLSTFLIGIALVGAGQGAYISADVALMTEVLPSKEDAGKDLGIVALAYLIPPVAVPAAGAFLTRIGSPTGQNFAVMYVLGIVLACLAALSVWRIRSVR